MPIETEPATPPTGSGRRPAHRAVLVPAALAFATALGGLLPAGGPARADAEVDLFDLLAASESVQICGFPMSEGEAGRLDAAVRALLDELGRDEAELDSLREQAAWQVLRQRREMCAPEGGWRARYDELLAALAG